MPKPPRSTPTWQSPPEGDPERIAAKCRKCLKEDWGNLPPDRCVKMLAVQRAMERTEDFAVGFQLDDVFHQIEEIAGGAEDVPEGVASEAGAFEGEGTPESFFTTYISGSYQDRRRSGSTSMFGRRVGGCSYPTRR